MLSNLTQISSTIELDSKCRRTRLYMFSLNGLDYFGMQQKVQTCKIIKSAADEHLSWIDVKWEESLVLTVSNDTLSMTEGKWGEPDRGSNISVERQCLPVLCVDTTASM
eukprot:TRINITY_DN3166_c0_g2_i1.p1 TRINITY_DN3166_c0_g2~~TRINITY_DN3166_c0_g2_i1.p1  ORF type:complete len:109 (+),score=0.82 TRINITY_DN3166_c0_g2_i1:193-519(+)